MEEVNPETMLVQHNGREYRYLDLLTDDFRQMSIGCSEKLRVVQKEGGIEQDVTRLS